MTAKFKIIDPRPGHGVTCERVKGATGPGPWHGEPDAVEFEHRGMRCQVIRNERMLNFCAYVMLPVDHPSHGMDYTDIDVVCHGGLTYSGVRPDGHYWVGLDFAHAGDYIPGIDGTFNKKWLEASSHYWMLGEVIEHVKDLVDQLIALGEAGG